MVVKRARSVLIGRRKVNVGPRFPGALFGIVAHVS
jgi:hypothetical protein